MRKRHAAAALALGLATAAFGARSGEAYVGQASATSQAQVEVKLPFEQYALANGLRVILHVDRRTPVVAVNIWYHVGSKDESPGMNGFAHLFEHLMFQGSKNVGEDMFFKYLERAGASDRNGTTSNDRTNYYETVPANQLELALWLESDRMGTLLDHANEETFKSQRDVVKNEMRQRVDNAPYGNVSRLINEELYPPRHPYHFMTIGTARDLDTASMDDVRAFFKTFYLPNNATIVIAGDIDVARTKQLVDAYFGPIARGAEPPVKKTPIPVTLDREKRLEVEADVELARVSITWPTPALFAAGDGELDLVSNVLASGKTSRLYKRLVYDMQLAQDVSAWQRSGLLASSFEISVTLKKGQKVASAIAAIDDELAKVYAAAPSVDEVERARAKILSGMVFAAESVTGRADAFNSYAQNAGDPGYFDDDVARYEKATPDAVQKAVLAWLPKDRRIVTVVTPTKSAPRAGRLVGSR